jgi:hypothetical protein
MLVEVITRFKAIMNKRQEADRKLLVLMSLPDVTAEQLVEANKACVATTIALTNAVTKLREKYPAQKSVMTLPWNRPELDKYHERKELTNVR